MSAPRSGLLLRSIGLFLSVVTSAVVSAAPSRALAAATPPTCLSILRSASSPTKASGVAFTVLFSEDVTGVDTGDFAVDASGVTGANVTAVTAIDLKTYVISVGTGTGNGTVSIDLADNDSIAATSGGVPLGGAGAGNGNFTSGQTYSIDKTAPSVTLSRVTSTPTNSDAVEFDVEFSEAVDPPAAGAVEITRTGSAGNAGTTVTKRSSSKYRVTLEGVTGAGSFAISLPGGATTDLADNDTPAAGPSSAVTVDRIAPTSTVTPESRDIRDATSANFSVVFSEVVTGFAAADVSVTHNGTASTSVLVESVSAKKYSVTVSGISGTGSFVIGVKANAVTDELGNGNAASAASASVSRSDSGSGTTDPGDGDSGEGDTTMTGSPCGIGSMGATLMVGPAMVAGIIVNRRRRIRRR